MIGEPSKISKLFKYSYNLKPELVLDAAHNKILESYGEKNDNVRKDLETNLTNYYYP